MPNIQVTVIGVLMYVHVCVHFSSISAGKCVIHQDGLWMLDIGDSNLSRGSSEIQWINRSDEMTSASPADVKMVWILRMWKFSCLEIGNLPWIELRQYFQVLPVALAKHMKIPIVSHHIFPWKAILFFHVMPHHTKNNIYIQKFTVTVWICRIRPPESWIIIWQFPSSVTKEWFLRSTPKPGSSPISYVPDNLNRWFHIFH